jgi:HlyD family secretion protein
VESTVANTRVGTVKACRRANQAPATAGPVARLNVKEGDKVEADQVLLEVWNEDLRAEVALAQSELASARAHAREVCLMAEGAEREAQRQTRLLQRKLVSEEVADRTLTDARSRRAACGAAEASIQVSESRVAVAQAALERTRLRAPFSGVVAEVNAEVGEFATPSPLGIQTLPAIDLVDGSCLYVSAPIDEVDAPAVQTGMKAKVTLDAFPNRHWSGTVRRIAPYVLEREKQARTVDMEVIIDNPTEFAGLLPGYSADIEVLLASREDVVRVPAQAVLEGRRVLIYDEKTGHLTDRRFEPGVANWDYTEVRSGLEPGEKVVLSVGKEGVKAGVRATPVQAR